jgi:anti-sigma factor RsiW
MTCKERDLLSSYLDGQLSPSEARRVAAHVEACSHCRGELADLRLASELVASLSAPRLATDLAPVVVRRAGCRRWHDLWTALASHLTPRRSLLLGQIARGVAILALFFLAAVGPGDRPGRLIASWPIHLAGAAGTAMAYVNEGLIEAQTFLGDLGWSPSSRRQPSPERGSGLPSGTSRTASTGSCCNRGLTGRV